MDSQTSSERVNYDFLSMTESVNISEKSHESDKEMENLGISEQLGTIQWDRVIVYSFLCILIILTNLIAIIKTYQRPRRKVGANNLFFHLCLADIIAGIMVVGLDAIHKITIQWHFGNIGCKLFKFFQAFGILSSTYLVVAISLDRCLAVIDPIGTGQASTRIKIITLSAWLFGAIFSFPQVFS